MAPRPKHTSRSRRRSRRAQEREAAAAVLVTPEQAEQFTDLALLAAASGSTSLPLSEQGATWDSGAAAKSLDEGDFPNAYFWVDPDGDPKTKAAYKLGFAQKISGKLTAIWRGVTAAAGAIQGARGGVQIPSADVAGVKAKIGSYYTKAAKQYNDPDIKPPWAASAGQSAAFLLAYAEVAALEPAEGEVVDRLYAEVDGEDVLVGLGGSGPVIDEFLVRLSYWQGALDEEAPEEPLVHDDELGGKPSPGTSKDRRLKENRPVPVSASAEREALQHVREALAEDVDDYAIPENEDGELVLPFARLIPRIGDAQKTDNGVSCPVDFVMVPVDGDGSEGVSAEEAFEQFRVHLENFELATGEVPPVAEELPPPNGPQPVVTPAPEGPSGEMRWIASIVPEATLTDDGRAMAPGALTWRDLPLTLMAMTETSEGGHVGAEVAGRIDEIYRDGNMLKATGVFAPTEYGQLIGQLVGDGTLRGVSVDLAIHQYEVGPKSDYFDDDGNWLTEKPQPVEEDEPPSLIDLLFGDEAAESIFVVTDAVIGAVTVCPFQAFADANIALAADGAPAVWTVRQQGGYVVTLSRAAESSDAEEAVPAEKTLTASAVEVGLAPVSPPAAWFDDPELEELTALTITEEGQIYGHAAAWDTCHLGIPDVCTTAPESETNYAYFLLKEVLCEDGERVPCGTITLGTGHADKGLGRADATAHYDNTALAAADVNVGEDEHGIWVAGAVRPDLSAEKARELRGAVLSGDWRSVNGNLELVALLAVNVPGFPVPRARALVASGEDGNEVIALVAAGITIGDVSSEVALAELSPVQQEKIRIFEAIASGRLAALRARAEGVTVSAAEAREMAGFATAKEPETAAEEPGTAPPADAEPPADTPAV